MGINKPYYRIYRPGSSYHFVMDSRNVDSIYTYIRSFQLLEQDLLRLFAYVEPADANLNTYSHRLYELLLRAATEFEANATAILSKNGYRKRRNLNISDFFKINSATRLSEYKVKCEIWQSKKEFIPFLEWNRGSTLTWYKNYNTVKHNRSENFSYATLENVMSAITGLIAILYAQFDIITVTGPITDGITLCTISDASGSEDPLFNKSVFHVVRPNWSESNCYSFDWQEIKHEENPFRTYNF